jgi:hypothetical protein
VRARVFASLMRYIKIYILMLILSISLKAIMKRAGKKAEDDAAVQIAAKQDAFDQLNTLYAEQVCTYVSECH